MQTGPHRLVFIDETGTTTKMTRARGHCERDERLAPGPLWPLGDQTFVAGLRCGALTAPRVIDAPMDRASFETYVRTQQAARTSCYSVAKEITSSAAHFVVERRGLCAGRSARSNRCKSDAMKE
jgi:hypothetical protein